MHKNFYSNARPWNPDKRYRVGDVVLYNGAYYGNKTGLNSNPIDISNWVFIAEIIEGAIFAKKDASNLSNENVEQWKEKLGVSGGNLQSVLDNSGAASSSDGNSEFQMDLENPHFSSVQKTNDLRTSIDQYPSSINLDSVSNVGGSRIVMTGNATTISQGNTNDTVSVSLDTEGALNYFTDYSSKFTDRSLVDKGFVKSLVTGVYKVKGSVADKDALDALTDMQEGDVYNLLDTGANYVYVLDLNNTGEPGWDDFFGSVDLSSINLQTVLNNGYEAYGDSSMSTYRLQPAIQGASSNVLLSQKNGFGSKYIDLEMFTPSTDFGGEAYFTLRVKNLPDAVFSIIMKDNALEYADNYSTYYNDRSVVDKGYVDTNNTLQKTLENGNSASSGDGSISIDLTNKSFNLGFYDPSTRNTVVQASYNGGIVLSHVISGGQNKVEITPSGTVEFIASNSNYMSTYLNLTGDQALTYLENYSSKFTDRSLVDKGFVNDVVKPTALPITLPSNVTGEAFAYRVGAMIYCYFNVEIDFTIENLVEFGIDSVGLILNTLKVLPAVNISSGLIELNSIQVDALRFTNVGENAVKTFKDVLVLIESDNPV